MKTIDIFKLITAVSLLAVYSCGKEIETEEQLGGKYHYSFSIDAIKGADKTKVLTLDGHTLNASWEGGEVITVYNVTRDREISGDLMASGSGTSTILKGTLDAQDRILVGDELTLKYLTPDYGNQNGTLTGNSGSIDKRCDFATASVTVTAVDGDNVSTTDAVFVNRQAIVKFTLNQANSASTVLAKTLQLIVNDNTITVTTPSDWVNTMFVAIPAFTDKQIVLYATDVEGKTFLYTRKGVSFAEGKYYEIAVTMPRGAIVYNEGELKSALYNNVPNIVLGCDIVLNSHAKVGDGDNTTTPIVTTLDLNGNTLSRNLSSIDPNGHVIEVYNDGTLTVKDSGKDGIIKGGRANNGGGICNYGTLYFQGGTITDCMANSDAADSGRGGAIYNHGTMVMSGGTLLGCWGKDCGGVWSDGNLTITGGTITGNTSNAGGGGVVNYATATITGGNIYNNTATTRGGGIWNSGSLELNGSSATVKVIGNHGTNYAGGICNIGTLNLKGNVTVSGNTMGTDGFPSNLWLGTGKVINITGSIDGSSIGVSCENNTGTVTNGLEGNGNLSNFFNDVPALASLQVSGSELALSSAAATVIHYLRRIWSGSITTSMEYRELANCTRLETNETQALVLSDDGWYYVSGSIVLERIIVPSGTANLILCDDSSLQANVAIKNDAALNIFGQQNGTGTLNAQYWGREQNSQGGLHTTPGIGGYDSQMGTLNVHGGIIISNCEYHDFDHVGNMAGIGGRMVYNDETERIERGERNGGIVNIYGGSVTAKGNTGCSGIGGSSEGDGGEVNIYGGTVTAVGGKHASGIGSGNSGNDSGVIRIYGGTVSATGGECGAGLGGGFYCKGGDIKIYGGDITAIGGTSSMDESGAGIGGGGHASGGTTTIYGGTVRATGGNDAAGIGSGEERMINPKNIDGGTISIYGGFVEAWGKSDGAGIGAGDGAASGNITISGGTVIAHGGDSSNAICSHDQTDGANSISIGNYMRLRVSDAIYPIISRYSIQSFKDIQIEECTHSGNPCTYCYFGSL